MYYEKEISPFYDLKGRPTKKTPFNSPYSFDPYVTWMGEYDENKSHTVYSDRMYQWDYKKFNQCCEEVFKNSGQFFDDREPKAINEFLNKYFDQKVKLTAIVKCCNVSTGFPYWRFEYEEM